MRTWTEAEYNDYFEANPLEDVQVSDDYELEDWSEEGEGAEDKMPDPPEDRSAEEEERLRREATEWGTSGSFAFDINPEGQNVSNSETIQSQSKNRDTDLQDDPHRAQRTDEENSADGTNMEDRRNEEASAMQARSVEGQAREAAVPAHIPGPELKRQNFRTKTF